MLGLFQAGGAKRRSAMQNLSGYMPGHSQMRTVSSGSGFGGSNRAVNFAASRSYPWPGRFLVVNGGNEQNVTGLQRIGRPIHRNDLLRRQVVRPRNRLQRITRLNMVQTPGV